MSEVNLTRGGFSGYCSAGITMSIHFSVSVSCADGVLQLLTPRSRAGDDLGTAQSQLLCRQGASRSCHHTAAWAQHSPS